MQRLTISRLAELGGVNIETVRYYERRGLLPNPPRTEAGYRQFPPDAAQRLRFIKRAQELGFSLEEVRELLALRVEPENCVDVRTRAQAKIADIEEKMKTLRFSCFATAWSLASMDRHTRLSDDSGRQVLF